MKPPDKTVRATHRRSASWFHLGLALLISPAALLPASAQPTNVLQHRGFTIDDSAVRAAANLEAIHKAMKGQIDIVCALGLPPEVLKSFQQVPLQIMPQEGWKVPTPGRYLAAKKVVQLGEGFVKQGNKPVLLHEFMHFYHNEKMSGGVRNADILSYFERARTLTVYDAKSHMMSNAGEFFACTTTTYLFGVTAQEPFKREKVKENQPVYFDYMKKLFGPEAGHHAGSLKP